MPNPGRAFVGTRRYAILFTCSAQPPIVTKEYRHVTLTGVVSQISAEPDATATSRFV
jgi:hypothetical protein